MSTPIHEGAKNAQRCTTQDEAPEKPNSLGTEEWDDVAMRIMLLQPLNPFTQLKFSVLPVYERS